MTELTAGALRAYRESTGLSIAEAARELRRRSPDTLPGVDSIVRSWKRWEAGAAPSRIYRPLLGALLDTARPRDDDMVSDDVDLAGDWWAAWQSSRDREMVTAVQPVRVRHGAGVLRWEAVQRGRPLEVGGFLWAGELRVSGESVMGWYAADDGAVRSKGVVYFATHAHGQQMSGRWVGLSWDGHTVTGLGAMARTKPAAASLIRELIDGDRG